jgi:serine/threonine-protein kinase
MTKLAHALADRYRIERELGRGGMATVYLATDLKHDRQVALKVLLPELAQSLGPERFQREIHFAARLQHPHILTVLDSGETAGQLWFTMPFVEGESLRDRLRRERQLSIEEALRITRDAVAFAQIYGQRGDAARARSWGDSAARYFAAEEETPPGPHPAHPFPGLCWQAG